MKRPSLLAAIWMSLVDTARISLMCLGAGFLIGQIINYFLSP